MELLWLGLPEVSPPSPLLGALRPIPLGVSVSLMGFLFFFLRSTQHWQRWRRPLWPSTPASRSTEGYLPLIWRGSCLVDVFCMGAAFLVYQRVGPCSEGAGGLLLLDSPSPHQHKNNTNCLSHKGAETAALPGGA